MKLPTIPRNEMKQKVSGENVPRRTLSFYRYVRIADPKAMRDELYSELSKLGCLGRIYVASEGINAQMNVPVAQWEKFDAYIQSKKEFAGVPYKIAVEETDSVSFYKLTIKVKEKIVADGLDDNSFDVTQVGEYLSAQEMNAYIDDPDAVVVDMRNNYESAIGHFENALTPNAHTFREELPLAKEALKGKEDKKVLLYCTGGIRCEKASAYFKHQGFKNVFQLEGGIINYAKQLEAEGLESKFIGKNFVFDHRLGERITDDIVSQCHQCGEPCDVHTNCVNEGCHLLFIQCDSCKEKMEGCCSAECVTVIHMPEEEQKAIRRGIKNGNKIFKKGKSDVLTFKNNEETYGVFVAEKPSRSVGTAIKKEPKVKKVYIGKGTHFFPKPSIGQFLIEENEIKIGDTILIKGATTGEQKVVIEEMLVNDLAQEKAVSGDTCTFKLPFRIRLSDKLYKIIE